MSAPPASVPAPRTVVASLCIGDRPEFRACLPLQQAYARRWGHAWVLLDKEVFRVRPNWLRKRRVGLHFEKFQLQALLRDHDRVLYLDADIAPTVRAPDIFRVVESGYWGCVPEAPGANDWKMDAEMDKCERRLGALPPGTPRRHFNAGLLVFDRSHHAIWQWNPRDVFPGRWPEQTLLNYRVLKHRVPVRFLDPRYNLSPLWEQEWRDDDTRRGAYFIHYASQPAKQAMAPDLEVLAREWGTSR